MIKVWLPLGLLYGVFLFWYGGCAAPLSNDEVQRISARLASLDVSPEARAQLTELARTDDGREFFMVNLNRYRDEPVYADGRPTDGASAEEIEWRYGRKLLPRLLARACHPWVVAAPIVALGGTPGPLALDRVTLVRYRSRRDFFDVVATDAWAEDAEHKWAALAEAHAYATRPIVALPGPRLVVLAVLFATGVGLRAIGRGRQRRGGRPPAADR